MCNETPSGVPPGESLTQLDNKIAIVFKKMKSCSQKLNKLE